MNFISIIYDILAAVIVLACVFRGKKDGFAKTAIQTVGYICAIIASLVISRICAALIYSFMLEPALVSSMEASLAEAVDAESVINNLTGAIEDLPAVSYLLFDFSSAAESLLSSVGTDYSAIAENVAESVIRPMMEPILETVIFAVSLIILGTVVSFIAKGSKIVNDVPVIGGINAFFGGVFGILNGILELCIGAAILRFIISAGLFPEYFSEEIISETYLFRWIYSAFSGDTFSMLNLLSLLN